MDLGAGSSYNIIDFFLISKTGLLVTTPETTSILSAYAFLKTAMFRMLFRSFPVRSSEREIIQNFITERMEGTDNSFLKLTELLSKTNYESGAYSLKQINSFYPRIVLNIGRNKQAIALGSKLRQICKKNIGINMEYIGFIEYTDQVSVSIIKRTALVLSSPNSQFARAIRKIAENLIQITYIEKPVLYDANEDIINLEKFV